MWGSQKKVDNVMSGWGVKGGFVFAVMVVDTLVVATLEWTRDWVHGSRLGPILEENYQKL
jgi:hypothetical protein